MMIKHIQSTETILYVSNQLQSAAFYTSLLRTEPIIDVPGMTSFQLSAHHRLGLMPNNGISKILGNLTPNPNLGNGIPRCELYFYIEDIELEYAHALQCGATLVSAIEWRNWGDNACYFADPDGHIIAFASRKVAD